VLKQKAKKIKLGGSNKGCIIFSVGERKKISPNAKFFAKK